jgi:lipoprotein-anchoring transpeptidase ErfK/SrfK
LKRGIRVSLVLLGLLLPGPCSAVAFAADGAAAAAPVPATSVPRPAFPARVRIAGVRLGGLDSVAAVKAVRVAFARPLPVVVDGAQVMLDPAKLATAYVVAAVARAHAASPGTNVKLVVSVHGAAVRAYVAGLAKRFDRKGVPARLTLLAGAPRISGDRAGHELQTNPVVAGVVYALGASTRLPLHFKTKTVTPALTSSQIGAVILINRNLNRLTYFDRGQLHRFPVATGQSIYPTPAGTFHIVVKWKNPWWYPPTYDAWAKGLKPVPPGPNNPLGTRWMGLSAPGVGIHGTDAPSSIGYSVSHGCIRMQVPDAEWLYNHVGVGTTVFIV